jgi:hypothetical protein
LLGVDCSSSTLRRCGGKSDRLVCNHGILPCSFTTDQMRLFSCTPMRHGCTAYLARKYPVSTRTSPIQRVALAPRNPMSIVSKCNHLSTQLSRHGSTRDKSKIETRHSRRAEAALPTNKKAHPIAWNSAVGASPKHCAGWRYRAECYERSIGQRYWNMKRTHDPDLKGNLHMAQSTAT